MKIMLDEENNYVECKDNRSGRVDLSIRTKDQDKSVVVITASLDSKKLDQLIAYLVTLKGKLFVDAAT